MVGNGGAMSPGTSWNTQSISYTATTTGLHTVAFVAKVLGNNPSTDKVYLSLDGVRIEKSIYVDCSGVDTDEDGTPDHLDPDSDGDGISDVIEAGFTDSDGDGKVDGTGVDTDGLVTGGDGYGTPADTDSDTTPNHLDLDSDNDNVSDANEVTNGTDPLLADTDGDTVNDNLDQCPNTPTGDTVDANGCSDSQIDTDGDGVYNDADLDDDNDGILDTEEGCSTTSTTTLAGEFDSPKLIISSSGSQNINSTAGLIGVSLYSPTYAQGTYLTHGNITGYHLGDDHSDEEITFTFSKPVTEIVISVTAHSGVAAGQEELRLLVNGQEHTFDAANFVITYQDPSIAQDGLSILGGTISGGDGRFTYTLKQDTGIESLKLVHNINSGFPAGSAYKLTLQGDILEDLVIPMQVLIAKAKTPTTTEPQII